MKGVPVVNPQGTFEIRLVHPNVALPVQPDLSVFVTWGQSYRVVCVEDPHRARDVAQLNNRMQLSIHVVGGAEADSDDVVDLGA